MKYPDLPWEYDPVRENPHIRDYLFDWYVQDGNKIILSYMGNYPLSRT